MEWCRCQPRRPNADTARAPRGSPCVSTTADTVVVRTNEVEPGERCHDRTHHLRTRVTARPRGTPDLDRRLRDGPIDSGKHDRPQAYAAFVFAHGGGRGGCRSDATTARERRHTARRNVLEGERAGWQAHAEAGPA